MGPKALEREFSEFRDDGRVAWVCGRNVASNEKIFPILKERSHSDSYTREI